MQRIGSQIALTVSDSQKDRVRAIANRLDIPKAQVYRNMIDVGLDLYDELEAIGVVKLVEFTRKVKEVSKDLRKKKQPTLF